MWAYWLPREMPECKDEGGAGEVCAPVYHDAWAMKILVRPGWRWGPSSGLRLLRGCQPWGTLEAALQQLRTLGTDVAEPLEAWFPSWRRRSPTLQP